MCKGCVNDMMGKQHMIVNSAIVIAGSSICYKLYMSEKSWIGSELAIKLIEYFYPIEMSHWLWIPWSFLLFAAMLFGSLLPDIDRKSSMLGRYFYVPIKHRTWTHTIWALLLFVILIPITPVFGAMFIGYGLHLVMDAVSAAGICWFYPLQQYRYYPNGAMVAKHHACKWYHAGKTSEKVMVYGIVIISAVIVYRNVL